MTIMEIQEPAEKQRIARAILEALPDWFGIEESREEYIKDSAELPLFAAFDGEKPIGFLCLKETGKETVELHVMGVLQEYHRKGTGRALFEKAKEAASAMESGSGSYTDSSPGTASAPADVSCGTG